MGSSRSLQPGKARCANATASGWRLMKRKVGVPLHSKACGGVGRQRIAVRIARIAPKRACSSRDVTMFVGVFSASVCRERSQW